MELNIGDLVYANGILGMVVNFDTAFREYKIQWCDDSHDEFWSWINVKEMRNNYLALRKDLV